jgi:glutathione S-transferase
VGLVNEIAGDGGFAWNARLLMLHAGAMAQGPEVAQKNPMYAEYQYDPSQIEDTKVLIESFLEDFAALIKTQYDNGSRYLVGSSLTAADVYWAYFSNMLQSLPPEQNPMPDGLRQSWAVLGKAVQGWDPILIEHRDRIFEEHLILPLSF